MKRYLLLAIIATIIYGTAFAQEVTAPPEPAPIVTVLEPESKPRFDISAGYWYTSASLDLKLFDEELGGKVSELNNDLDAGLFVINTEAYLFWRLYADIFIGWGDFEGDHTDSDWILPEQIYPKEIPPEDVSEEELEDISEDGITWGEAIEVLGLDLDLDDPVSISKSDADGSVRTWDINGYIRVLEHPEDQGYLDVSLGYFYYQDDIEHLRNTTLVISDWEAVNEPIAGHDSSDKYTFDGIRLGARGRIRLHEKAAVKASGGITPWLNVEREWFWNLAGHQGEGEAEGTAYDLNIGIEFKLTKNLFIEVGYRYINIDSEKGDLAWDFLATPGVDIITEDNWDVEIERGGFYGMGRLKI